MIINMLDQKIKDMKELQRLENLKSNKEQQEIIDVNYHALVENIHQIVLVMDLLHKEVNIKHEENIKYKILELLDELKKEAESGLVNKEKVLSSKNKLRAIQAECKKFWTKQYSLLTSAKISTLKVVSGIDAEKVSLCLQDIKKAEDWNTDVLVFQTMIKGLKSADELISNLGLNQEIISFLKNMNQGKATLIDLTDDVLKWIQKENLESKIKISFRGVSRNN